MSPYAFRSREEAVTAAAKLTHYLKPKITTLYTTGAFDNQLFAKARFRKADAQQKDIPAIHVYRQFWNQGDWLNAFNRLDNTPPADIVPPVLVYADLIASGDARNREAAGKVYDNSETVEVYAVVSEAAAALGVPIIVVGASARDMVMHHGYGAPIERATQDVDFGIQLPGWNAFNVLKAKLKERGFTSGRVQHRLYSAGGTPIDIVPFGGNQNEDAQIHWPPEGDKVMNVLGFQEACDNALQVRIRQHPVLDIPVASPEGMVLLKLVAWTDRSSDVRTKDASDLLYLVLHYEDIPVAAAHELGVRARQIARNKTAALICDLFGGQHGAGLSVELLAEEAGDAAHYERNNALVKALVSGFLTNQ